MLTKLIFTFNNNISAYTIEGGDQGKPAYKFEKEGEYVFLSIVDSMLGGKADKNWQRVQFKYRDFLSEFTNFKGGFKIKRS